MIAVWCIVTYSSKFICGLFIDDMFSYDRLKAQGIYGNSSFEVKVYRIMLMIQFCTFLLQFPFPCFQRHDWYIRISFTCVVIKIHTRGVEVTTVTVDG